MRSKQLALSAVALAAAFACGQSIASSHREAPFITTAPKVDGTDFYMFRSYEGVAANGSGGRSDYVTLLANYQPLQDPYGGPNYFSLDPNALYEIHIDNNGDAKEDITFQFRATNTLRDVQLPIGAGDAQKSVSIPLIQAGTVSGLSDPNLNVVQTYTIAMVRGDRRSGQRTQIGTPAGVTTFAKPVDYIGTKTLGDAAAYATYAAKHIFEIKIPGCAGNDVGRVFVGQRQDGFAVNLGPIFDLVNAPLAVITNPANINAQLTRELTHDLFSHGDPPLAALEHALEILRDTDLRAQLAQIDCPVLLQYGDKDMLTPLGAAQWLAQVLPQSRLVVHAGAAHAPFLSHVDDFAAAQRRFLGEI